jgi:RNA polymerase sigma-70 factor (ECF subfamily)
MNRSKLEKQFADHIIKNNEGYYRLAYSYVKNVDDALDIVQESICKGMSSLDSLRNPAYFRTWFYKIVIHTALDFLRQRNKTVLMEEEVLINSNCGTCDTYQNIDLGRALDSLPAKYRTIIILRYFEDLKIEDVAEILDENVNTVKTRLYTALRKLSIEMVDHDERGRICHE